MKISGDFCALGISVEYMICLNMINSTFKII